MTVREATGRSEAPPPSPMVPVKPVEAIPPGGAAVQARLDQAEETLRAIRHGEVDALVVSDNSPVAQVFTLSSADRPYRRFVENMRDGAATVSEPGIVLYANRRLAELLGWPLQHIMGSPIASFIAEGDRDALLAISARDGPGGMIEADLLAKDGQRIPVRVNTWTLEVDWQELLCITFADLTQQNAQKREIDRLVLAQADRMRELELAQAALTHEATHDSLTGLPSRNLLIDRLTQALALAKRSGKSTGLLFVDLDRFKEINDSRGHAAGDRVLREIAERLLSAVRPMDSVSRLGGDEFVVLLPGLETSLGATAVAERIAAVIDPPIKLEHGQVTMTASIGISVCDATASEQETDPDRLLRQADVAMYQAKSLGGSRTALYNPASTYMMRAADGEMWITRIRQALDEGRFVLYAQPIVELATGKVAQRELLLRMRDRDGHIIPPLAFLPTAEKSGLITEIDQWVVTEASKIAAAQPVAVNLSAWSAGDPGMLDVIERELLHHETNPGNLVFEITETAVLQNADRAALFADHLVALGCKFALDDFGTGFASFTHLKQLPVQYLKIDIEFVRNLAHSQQDMAVVRAIVALAGDFGQETIAEGVEDQPTADIVRGLGVTYAQGFLYGRPRPVTDLVCV